MPVGKEVGALPERANKRRAKVSDEFKEMLAEMAERPGNWFAYDSTEDKDVRTETEKIHRTRLKYANLLKREGITGYEFRVVNGTVYGQKTTAGE